MFVDQRGPCLASSHILWGQAAVELQLVLTRFSDSNGAGDHTDGLIFGSKLEDRVFRMAGVFGYLPAVVPWKTVTRLAAPIVGEVIMIDIVRFTEVP